jgi:asparagine synthetase B (glutamine-hydrolysing)
MCGIGGIRRFGEEPIVKPQIDSLLLSLEKRGNDAAGVALMTNGDIELYKTDDPAWMVVSSQKYKDFLKDNLKPETTMALVHTRWATKGSPRKNENNHPLFAGNAAVVHNGCISNDDELFREMKLSREAEVDSDIIRAIADEEGISSPKAIRAFGRLRGSCAAALVSAADPDHLLLLRSESPLVVASTKDHLLWASTKEALHSAVCEWKERFGIWMRSNRTDVAFTPMANNTALCFGPEGCIWHQEFKSAYYTRTEPRYAIYDSYSDRQKKWDATESTTATRPTSTTTGHGESHKPKYVVCRKKECRKIHELLKSQQDKPLHLFMCRACKTPFEDAPAA